MPTSSVTGQEMIVILLTMQSQEAELANAIATLEKRSQVDNNSYDPTVTALAQRYEELESTRDAFVTLQLTKQSENELYGSTVTALAQQYENLESTEESFATLQTTRQSENGLYDSTATVLAQQYKDLESTREAFVTAQPDIIASRINTSVIQFYADSSPSCGDSENIQLSILPTTTERTTLWAYIQKCHGGQFLRDGFYYITVNGNQDFGPFYYNAGEFYARELIEPNQQESKYIGFNDFQIYLYPRNQSYPITTGIVVVEGREK